MHPGDTGLWPHSTDAEGRLSEVVLRFIETRHLRAEQGLLLVRYSPLEGEPHGSIVSYRRNGAWIEPSPDEDKDKWFFEGPESESAAEYPQFFDLLPRFEGTVAAHLQQLATEWFDGRELEIDSELNPGDFCGEAPRLEVSFSSPKHCHVELVTDYSIWHRSPNRSWKRVRNLSIQDTLRRSAINDAANRHLEASLKFEPITADERDGQWAQHDEAFSLAMALGGSFQIIPTFDSHLMLLEEEEALNWTTVRRLLSLSATAGFSCNQDGQAAELFVQQGKQKWVREHGEWVWTERQLDSQWSPTEIEISRLTEAVTWWDTFGSKLPPEPAPSYSSSGSVAFVTDVDPCGSSDFPLLDLVFGLIDDGRGLRRTSGHWEEDYIGALDMENHMPRDEGDLRPWGGQYLYVLGRDAAALAVEFWDYGRRDCGAYPPSWTDFAGPMSGRN
jgi:hypothetical protein